MKIENKRYKRVCDLCNGKIVFNREYSCIMCGVTDLCQECRISLTRLHKRRKYVYETIKEGYLCKFCIKGLKHIKDNTEELKNKNKTIEQKQLEIDILHAQMFELTESYKKIKTGV